MKNLIYISLLPMKFLMWFVWAMWWNDESMW